MSDKQRTQKPEWKSNVEFFTSLSADGRFVICKTVITAVKPIRYFEKIMAGKSHLTTSEGALTTPGENEKAGG